MSSGPGKAVSHRLIWRCHKRLRDLLIPAGPRAQGTEGWGGLQGPLLRLCLPDADANKPGPCVTARWRRPGSSGGAEATALILAFALLCGASALSGSPQSPFP